jgi:Mg2+ and Co2+ transporter CorA
VQVERAIAVDFDDRDFVTEAPAGARYVVPPLKLSASQVNAVSSDLKTHLQGSRSVTVFQNAELKLWSRPAESREDFQARCQAAANASADDDTAKVRQRLEAKRDTIQAAIAKAQDQADQIEATIASRRQSSFIDIGASVLGGLLGGRGGTRQLASAARRMSSGHNQNASGEARLESIQRQAADKSSELQELEDEVSQQVMDIDQAWSTKAAAIAEVAIPLEKSDVTVDELMLVWLPTAS